MSKKGPDRKEEKNKVQRKKGYIDRPKPKQKFEQLKRTEEYLDPINYPPNQKPRGK